jgi:hypothetical protein
MIDSFSLALTHALLLLVAWRLLSRPDLDEDPQAGTEPPAPKSRRWTLGGAKPDA